MKIIFMGTAPFALPSLEKLMNSGHSVVAVVSGPDRKKGRGLKLLPSPVKVWALERGLPVLQPERLKDPAFISELEQFSADVYIIVAYRILPESVFRIPPQGTVNLHASLLPSYRGAAPIQWAIIRGETKTGVTTFFIDEGIDTGNIILQKEVSIAEDETAGELHDRLALTGADVLLESVEQIALGTVTRTFQSSEYASPAPKIFRQDGSIDWSLASSDIRNHVRGMTPYPGAYSHLNGQKIKVMRVIPGESVPAIDTLPGSIIKADGKDGLCVATGDGALFLETIQPGGKKVMSSYDFVRGNPVRVGDLFENEPDLVRRR